MRSAIMGSGVADSAISIERCTAAEIRSGVLE
jgi:hypothetical protein